MQVVYERDEVELDMPDGLEVGAIQRRLKRFMGIPRDAYSIVDGLKVGPDHLAGPNSTVEFRLKWGQKGVGQVWTAAEYCQLFGLSIEELDQQIRKGLRVMSLSDGTMRISETSVDGFVNGNGDGAFFAVIASSLKRIADHVDPPPPDIIGTDYIAEKLGLTKVWVAKMAAEGTIPRNCIVPGTGIGKPWKFYRSRIDPWIEMR